MPTMTLPQFEGPVLSTLNPDGSRRWLSPRLAKGRFWRRRLVVAWSLIALFTALPWLRVDGLPVVQLDVVARHFTFFGTVFRPTDTLLLALLALSIFLGIFLLTAVLGRAWCGWACPQTVYMEFVYRPIERFFLGTGRGTPKAPVAAWRRIAMYAAFLVLSAHLANTFLAYFVGTDNLTVWTLGAPSEHPVAFAVFAATTGLMMFDFCFFREQMCTIACPYGRLQSVLLDRRSLIVGYDARRGEPRGRPTAAPKAHPCRRAGTGECCGGCAESREAEPAPRVGDCVDCRLCVAVCPTGIDIRNGLQLECLHCTQCIDACDGVMAKLGRTPGLIRYGSQDSLEGAPRRGFRPRLVVYPLLLALSVGGLVALLATRQDAMVVQLRSPGETYRLVEGGAVESPLRLRIDNRTREVRTYSISLAEGTEGTLSGPAKVEVPPTGSADGAWSLRGPSAAFASGRRVVGIRVADGADYDELIEVTLLGPLGAIPGGVR